MIKNREEIQNEMDNLREELKDVIELRQAFLGQTGVHIGMRVLKSSRAKFDQEEARIRKRITFLEELINEQRN